MEKEGDFVRGALKDQEGDGSSSSTKINVALADRNDTRSYTDNTSKIPPPIESQSRTTSKTMEHSLPNNLEQQSFQEEAVEIEIEELTSTSAWSESPIEDKCNGSISNDSETRHLPGNRNESQNKQDISQTEKDTGNDSETRHLLGNRNESQNKQGISQTEKETGNDLETRNLLGNRNESQNKQNISQTEKETGSERQNKQDKLQTEKETGDPETTDIRADLKKICPWKNPFTAEQIFTFVFLIFLLLSNFGFALGSGISAHMVIRNLEPLNDYIFGNMSFHNAKETFGELNCSLIKHAVWSLCIVMVVPTVLTIYEARYMLTIFKEEEIIKKILAPIIILDVLGFSAKIALVLLFLPAFDPYVAAVLCFVLNPTYFRFPCRAKKECFLSALTIISNVFVVAGVITFIIINYNGKSSGILMAMLVCATVPISIWDNFLNTKGGDKVTTNGYGDNQERKQSECNENSGNSKDKNQQEENHEKYCLCLSKIKDYRYHLTAAGFSSIAKLVLILGLGMTLHFMDIKIYSSQGSCNCLFPYHVAGVNIAFSFMCYLFSKTACKILRQKLCFATPLIISVILTPVILYLLDHVGVPYFTSKTIDPLLSGTSSTILFKNDPVSSGVLLATYVCAFLFFILSIRHSCVSKGRPPGCRFRLFIKPTYSPLFTVQSLLQNRRRVDKISHEETSGSVERPKLYICATMWHEKRKEMAQLITSILRMDKEHPQPGGEMNKEHPQPKGETNKEHPQPKGETNKEHPQPKGATNKVHPQPKGETNKECSQDVSTTQNQSRQEMDLEVHIIFDDAFDENGIKLNRYAEELCDTLNQFVRQDNKPEKPKAIRTPYGGRLVWTLPHKNKCIVHLKNTDRVRKKKRWSQILYMHYFVQQLEKFENSKTKLENSFVLALDGDVSFKPKSVRLLIERMQKNEKVGAACGRIHPKGSGPMVWFQKFEYAISHWLQKSTEHVLGCVLCSPGCFSLFRASAIKDTVEKYSKKPKVAEEHVRFDQGEDRWYSQILLQAGYKIEYCAAADAQTYAPEGFFELYKQRRRWTPSTLGNILAIIMKGSTVVKSNTYISRRYILYQAMLFITSILTPGTIFLLILGSIMTAFPEIDPLGALMINLIPVALFTISCLVFSENIQLYVAGMLSNIYALMMLAVLVGLLQISVEAGFCSLTTIFMIYVASIFVVAAILHPKEFKNLLYGPVYFLAIPSTSMLMMIYALTNLHVISWGTRETESKISTGKSHSMFRKIDKYLCCRTGVKNKVDVEKGENEINENDNYNIEFDTQRMHQETTDKKITCLWNLPVETVTNYDLMLRNQDNCDDDDDNRKSLNGNKTKCTFKKKIAANTCYKVSLIATFSNQRKRVFKTMIKTRQEGYKRPRVNLMVPEGKITDSSAVVKWTEQKDVTKYHIEWRETESKKLKDECVIKKEVQENSIMEHREKCIGNLSPQTSYQIILTVTFTDKTQNVEKETFTTKEPKKWFESEEFEKEGSDYTEDENKILENIKTKYLQEDAISFKVAQEEKNRIHEELLSLRSKICVMFIMLNIIFVTIIYILTHISTYQGTLSITLWCRSEDVASQTKLEPISITFIVMFGVLLLIQFVSMLVHRISTMIQVLASNKNKSNIDENKTKNQTAVSTKNYCCCSGRNVKATA